MSAAATDASRDERGRPVFVARGLTKAYGNGATQVSNGGLTAGSQRLEGRWEAVEACMPGPDPASSGGCVMGKETSSEHVRPTSSSRRLVVGSDQVVPARA